MSFTNTQPTNKNFLSPLGFRFAIKKTPNVNFFVQAVNLPGIMLGETQIPTPFSRVPVAGDHVTFGDVTVTFKVDEQMANYLEIYNWIINIGFPDNFEQYQNVDPKTTAFGEGIYSDLSLTILSSSNNPRHVITFENAFPIQLTDLAFDARMSDVEYLEASATFKFRKFSIETL